MSLAEKWKELAKHLSGKKLSAECWEIAELAFYVGAEAYGHESHRAMPDTLNAEIDHFRSHK